MQFKQILILIALCMAIGFFGCAREKKAEAPKQEQVTKNLVPPKAEVKGQNFLVDLSGLQLVMQEDTASKKIVETPSLQGNIKITNQSQDVMAIQAVTVEYLDEAGKPIGFESGEKIAKANLYLSTLKPGETTEGSLDVTIPKKAIEGKTLAKMEINVVYIPSPLNRETLSVPEKIE
jgi:hypothetical protein